MPFQQVSSRGSKITGSRALAGFVLAVAPFNFVRTEILLRKVARELAEVRKIFAKGAGGVGYRGRMRGAEGASRGGACGRGRRYPAEKRLLDPSN